MLGRLYESGVILSCSMFSCSAYLEVLSSIYIRDQQWSQACLSSTQRNDSVSCCVVHSACNSGSVTFVRYRLRQTQGYRFLLLPEGHRDQWAVCTPITIPDNANRQHWHMYIFCTLSAGQHHRSHWVIPARLGLFQGVPKAGPGVQHSGSGYQGGPARARRHVCC